MPSAKAAAAASESLARLYGQRVQVRYFDLDDPQVRVRQAEATRSFAEEGWPLPVTLLDGSPLFVGGLQPARLVAAVARELARPGQPKESA